MGNDACLGAGPIVGNGSPGILGAVLRGAVCGSREDLSSLCAASNGPSHLGAGNGLYAGGSAGHSVAGGADLDGGKLASLPPVKLNIPHKVVQAATGVHHTGEKCFCINFYCSNHFGRGSANVSNIPLKVWKLQLHVVPDRICDFKFNLTVFSVLLLDNGSVLTFGSNHHGQLGHGTRSVRGAPGPLQGLPGGIRVVQVAAGSNHTVLLLANGSVYTCGNPLVRCALFLQHCTSPSLQNRLSVM